MKSNTKEKKNRYYFGIEKDREGNEQLVICYFIGKFDKSEENIRAKLISCERLEEHFGNSMQEVINGLVTVIVFGIGGTLIENPLPKMGDKSAFPRKIIRRQIIIQKAESLSVQPGIKLVAVTQCNDKKEVAGLIEELFGNPKEVRKKFALVQLTKSAQIKIDNIVEPLEKKQNIIAILDLLIINHSIHEANNPDIDKSCIIDTAFDNNENYLTTIIDQKLNNEAIYGWSSANIYSSLSQRNIIKEKKKLNLHLSTSSEEASLPEVKHPLTNNSLISPTNSLDLAGPVGDDNFNQLSKETEKSISRPKLTLKLQYESEDDDDSRKPVNNGKLELLYSSGSSGTAASVDEKEPITQELQYSASIEDNRSLLPSTESETIETQTEKLQYSASIEDNGSPPPMKKTRTNEPIREDKEEENKNLEESDNYLTSHQPY